MLNYLNLDYTPAQKLVQQTVRDFIDHEAMPLISDAFESATFPRQLISRMGELGLLGATVPEYGSGLDYTSYGLLCQELERGDSGLRSFVSGASLFMYPVWAFGSEEQKRKYLPEIHAGRMVGCFGLTEPDHGSDPAAMETRAVKDGDGWVLNGVKMWITNGPFSDVALIWAKVQDGDKDTIRGFIVETGTPGYTINPIHKKLSLRISETAELVFTDCRLPGNAILPNVSTMRGAFTGLTQARFGITFGVVGAAMSCYETALEYSKARPQWGRPIAGFQLTQEKLVDALQAITQAQLMCHQIGLLKDANTLSPAQLSLVKRANCAMALNVARSMRSILGGNGILLDYPIFRHMVNLETVYTYEGTHEIHTLVVGADITGLPAYQG